MQVWMTILEDITRDINIRLIAIKYLANNHENYIELNYVLLYIQLYLAFAIDFVL